MTEAYLIGRVPYMLPVNIAWHNLAKLQLFVTHADKDGIANMVAQLPVLEELAIECESMYLDDVGSSIYPDQRDTTEGLAIVVDEEDDSPISDTLKCFKVQTQQEFDIYGFCELVCRFLAVNVAVVKSYYVESVEDVLNWHYQGGRQISIQPYPEQ
ncbi:hypothetical protein EC988_002663 [Linderina pennispora]|nr:hypothetical protein EC988_002663 [Linderina pennispora]